MVQSQIHPMFQIILDNWRLHGFAAKKESSTKTSTSDMAEKKTKNIYPFPRRMEKKTK